MSKKKNKIEIIIISLEGKESCTELNFYEGMNNWIHDHDYINNIHAKAIGKCGQSTNDENKFKNIVNALLRELSTLLINNVCEIFFIGDGDKKDQIPAMEKAKKIFKNKINDLYSKNTFKLHEKILLAENGFEEMLEIKNMKNTKKNSNKRLFNNIVNKKNWDIDEKIDWYQIYNFFKNTSYEILFCLFTKQKKNS